MNILLGKPLPVYGDGMQVRDWLHVADHCEAIGLALRQGVSGEVYNIGGSGETANINIVRSLCELVDRELLADPQNRALYPASPVFNGRHALELITHVRDRQGHDRRYAINANKIERELGWHPAETFASGLRRTVEWYLAHQDWVQQVTTGAYRQWIDLNYAHRGSGTR